MKIPLDHLNCTSDVNLAFFIYESEARKLNTLLAVCGLKGPDTNDGFLKANDHKTLRIILR